MGQRTPLLPAGAVLSEEACAALCLLPGCSRGQELGWQQPCQAKGHQQRPRSACSLSGGHSRASQSVRGKGALTALVAWKLCFTGMKCSSA